MRCSYPQNSPLHAGTSVIIIHYCISFDILIWFNKCLLLKFQEILDVIFVTLWYVNNFDILLLQEYWLEEICYMQYIIAFVLNIYLYFGRFDSLSEMIYSEVAALISKHENRPHYLLELIILLQKLKTSTLRQQTVDAFNEIISDYLTDDQLSVPVRKDILIDSDFFSMNL